MRLQHSSRIGRLQPRHPNRIHHYRLLAGLSQNALARRIGVRRMTISSWERGFSCPSTKMLLLLARTLGTLAEHLYRDYYFVVGTTEVPDLTLPR